MDFYLNTALNRHAHFYMLFLFLFSLKYFLTSLETSLMHKFIYKGVA